MGKQKSFDEIDPPPYDEIDNLDEFEPRRSLAVPSAPILHQSILVSPISPQPLPNPTSNNTTEETGDNYQNEIFKKPPKFLLYPSTSKEGSLQESSTGGGQGQVQQARATSSYNMIVAQPQPQPYMHTGTGVSMSASKLPQQVNAPLHSYVQDNYLPRYSYRMVCPSCKKSVTSMVQYVSGQLTHLVALVACWFTCCLVCVPYFIDDLKDAEHICPECRGVLGYNRKKVFN